MADYTGTAGNNHFVGTADFDTFDMTQGGKDWVEGGAGGSQIDMGATLTAADRLWGGDGFDVVSIQGDYSAGLTLGPNTFHGIDRLQFLSGFDYRLTLTDGDVDPGTTLDLSNDHNANSIWVDASALVNGGAVGTFSNRPNTIIGSQSDDGFQEFTTAFDLDGQGGSDVVFAYNGLARESRFDGGAGADILLVYSELNSVLLGSTLRHVETLNLQYASRITFANGNVDAGASMTVNLSGASWVNASAETSGHYVINGSGENDTLIGGGGADTVGGSAGRDRITGGRGADALTGGDGSDVFIYNAAGDSTRRAHDLITDFDARRDHIDLSDIDARADRAGDQAFHLVAKFTHVSGQLTLTYDSDANVTHVQGDVDGDGRADLYIDVSGQLTDASGFTL